MRKYSKVSVENVSKKIEIRQKYFDVWEADEVLPTLEFYVHELQAAKKQISSIKNVLNTCAPDKNKNTEPICANLKQKLNHQCAEYISVIKKISDLGIISDNLDVMAFDFYSWLDGEEIVLCWQSGEKKVFHWHYPEENFSERRVLDVIDIMPIENEEQYLN